MNDPEPIEGQTSEPQESGQESQLNKQTDTLEIPTALVIIPTTSLIVSASFRDRTNWIVPGKFDVDGVFGNGQTCCVTGSTSQATFESAVGVGLGLTWKSLELELSAFQDVNGSTTLPVSICRDGLPDIIEEAVIDMKMDWQVTLATRVALLDFRVGPGNIRCGISGGLAATHLVIGSGSSESAHFDVSDSSHQFAGLIGPFVGLTCDIGGLQGRLGADLYVASIGDVVPDEEMLNLTLGVSVQF